MKRQVEEEDDDGNMVTRTESVFYYYTGNVGNLPHDENCYRDIARQIMGQRQDGDDGEKVWPEEAAVVVIRGKREVEEPWTMRADEDDFLHGGHF